MTDFLLYLHYVLIRCRMLSDGYAVCVLQLLERRAHELELVIGRLMKECLLSEEVQEEIGRGLGLIKDTAAAREV